VDADPEFEGVDYIVLPIIVYMDRTTLDGLGRTSCYPLYLSLANFSREVYKTQHGMVLCALLPCPVADADWPHPGWKPKSEGFKETKRFFLNWALSIIFESAHLASFRGVDIVDPNGVKRKAVPFIYCISKDLGEASSISSVRSSACISCLVPRKELACLRKACETGDPPRCEGAMW
jgi:hypothetical protein